MNRLRSLCLHLPLLLLPLLLLPEHTDAQLTTQWERFPSGYTDDRTQEFFLLVEDRIFHAADSRLRVYAGAGYMLHQASQSTNVHEMRRDGAWRVGSRYNNAGEYWVEKRSLISDLSITRPVADRYDFVGITPTQYIFTGEHSVIWLNTDLDETNRLPVPGGTIHGALADYGIIHLARDLASDGVVELSSIDLDGNIVATDSVDIGGMAYTVKVLPRPDGTVLLAGRYGPNPNQSNLLLLSNDGELLRTNDRQISTGDAILLPDGGVILGGLSTNVQAGNLQTFERYDANLDLIWSTVYEPSQQELDYPNPGDLHLDLGFNGDLLVGGTHYYYQNSINPECANPYLSRHSVIPTELEIKIRAFSGADTVHTQPGGQFAFHATLRNNTMEVETIDVWVIARGPDGISSDPFRVWEEIEVPANGAIEQDLLQGIPAGATAGRYNYIVQIGNADTFTPRFQSHIPLVVAGAAPAGDRATAAFPAPQRDGAR